MDSPHDTYLTNDVLTASPQKLHLLLIEGAIRHAERGKAFWKSGDNEQACEAMIKAQEIVTELTTALDREAAPELASKMSAVYLFIFRRLMEGNLKRDEKLIDEALRILRVERDTWRLVCEKGQASQEEQAGGAPPHRHVVADLDAGPATSSSFSLEA